MRKLFLILVLFAGMQAGAQIELSNSILAKPHQNLLFIGIDNPITISGKGWDSKKMDLRVPYSLPATKVDENKFIVRVSSVTDSFPITITDDDKAVFTSYYRVRTVEQISVRVGEIDRDETLSTQEIVSTPIISSGIKHLNFKLLNFKGFLKTNKLSSYTVKISDEKGNVLYEKTNTEAHLNDEQITLIKSLSPGSILELKKCLASGISNEIEVKGLKITIR